MRVGHDAGAVLTTSFDPVDAVLPIRALRGDLSRCHPSSEECLHLAGPDPQGGQAAGAQRYGA